MQIQRYIFVQQIVLRVYIKKWNLDIVMKRVLKDFLQIITLNFVQGTVLDFI